MLRARLRALDAAREARLDGDDESGGTLVLGGGGKVMLTLGGIGYSGE